MPSRSEDRANTKYSAKCYYRKHQLYVSVYYVCYCSYVLDISHGLGNFLIFETWSLFMKSCYCYISNECSVHLYVLMHHYDTSYDRVIAMINFWFRLQKPDQCHFPHYTVSETWIMSFSPLYSFRNLGNVTIPHYTINLLVALGVKGMCITLVWRMWYHMILVWRMWYHMIFCYAPQFKDKFATKHFKK